MVRDPHKRGKLPSPVSQVRGEVELVGRSLRDQVKICSANWACPMTLWQPAFEELEYYDPRLAIGLEDLMEQVTQSPGNKEWSKS